VPFKAGDTFYLTHATGSTPHLWVLLWGPQGAADAFIGVFLTTRRPYSDSACVLYAGDHPFIRHETAVRYNSPVRWTEAALNEIIALGQGHLREAVTSDVLERLRRGFFVSARTPHAFVEMARRDYGAT
jgi:hypothetical protein